MKFAFIERQRCHHRITTLCRVISVSKAGFYDWCERERTPLTDRLALETASRAYVLVTGELALAGACADLREDPRIKGAYLGENVSA